MSAEVIQLADAMRLNEVPWSPSRIYELADQACEWKPAVQVLYRHALYHLDWYSENRYGRPLMQCPVCGARLREPIVEELAA